MGAQTFEWHQRGADVKEAFREATGRACYLHGHGGYTGTLAEKRDYTVIRKEPVPLGEAQRLGDALIHAADPRIDDKWGPAGAIATCDEEGGPVTGWYFFGWASS